MNDSKGPPVGTEDFADLEISLHRRDAVSWSVELRFSMPGSDTDVNLDVDGTMLADIDPRRLDVTDDDEEYGLVLGRGLFAHGVGEAYRKARATAQSKGHPLRVRLVIGNSARSLHGIRWETLRDPVQNVRLLMDENVLFSRYLSSQDWRPVSVRAREELTALAVVAAPDDLETIDAGRPLGPVRVDDELARAREALDPVQLTALPDDGPATAANLVARLRDGYDILYLVCHGYVRNEEPVLVLVDDEGHSAPMLGIDLIDRLAELQRLPRLVFLASCQSAGAGLDATSDDAGVLAALGPRLAQIGVPAVIAMQGDITMATAGEFAKEFFASLNEDGVVDRAMAVARGRVRERPDWWAPTLFLRMRSGRIWYAPGVTRAGFTLWPSLMNAIRHNMCTPIIGPGISDSLLGSRQEIARDWARSYGFPLAPYNRQSLPQVAQYLSINQNSPQFPRWELENYLRRTLVARYRSELPDELLRSDASLEDLIAGAWEVRHEREVDPYSVLAELPVPVYVTTQPSQLLVRALADAGRRPHVQVCRWYDDIGWSESDDERDDDYYPTPHEPLVFHLLGAFDDPDSLVLTEDDYFDFLIGVTKNPDVVPSKVRERLSNSALMFVGFRVDEWDFRVLYRSLMNSEGRRRRELKPHVAVQIDPEGESAIDAPGARRYLEKYFSDPLVSLYWGTTEHFVRELNEKWQEADQ